MASSPARGCGSATSATSPARGWEGHALNLRNHFWSQTADPATLSFDTYTEDVVATLERFGSGVVVVGHGMGGLLALKAAERMPISGLVLLSAELPRELRTPARPHELREIPEVYGKALIGWETLPERLLRDERDLTLADVLRIQHLLGQKPHEAGAARRQMLAGVPIDRRGLDGRAAARRRRRARPDGPARRLGAARRVARAPATSRSRPTRITGWSSARTASSRSPTSIRGFLETNRL